MKYIGGSLIISFGVLLVLVIVMNAMQIKAPDDVMTYLGIAWAVLAIVMYPLARKIVR
ncbi:MAG: hypothetical protein AAF431_12525 [Pseudomonadota bacterium]